MKSIFVSIVLEFYAMLREHGVEHVPSIKREHV